MARLATIGFEGVDVRADGFSDAINAVAGAARSGSYGYRQGDGTGQITFSHTGVLARTYYLRFYLRKSANPSSSFGLFTLTTGLYNTRVNLKTDGTLELTAGLTPTIVCTSSALSNAQWYRVEVSWQQNSGAADDHCALQIDGVSVGSSTTQTVSTTAHNGFVLGGGASVSSDIDIDDVALNDDQGASQNSWPGSGKVVLCLPVSDAQDGSWRGGADTTGIDLSTAVNNTPPQGTNAGSDTTTIESVDTSGDNSTDEYRANLTTYTAAGVGASDTISVLHPIIDTAEQSSTGTKTGSFGLQSNPSQTYATIASFGTGNSGTWPTNWTLTRGSPVYSPSVTLGSNPVLAVRKTDTGSRVAQVDYMAMYVDYVPAAAPTFTAPPVRVSEQAVNRKAYW